MPPVPLAEHLAQPVGLAQPDGGADLQRCQSTCLWVAVVATRGAFWKLPYASRVSTRGNSLWASAQAQEAESAEVI